MNVSCNCNVVQLTIIRIQKKFLLIPFFSFATPLNLSFSVVCHSDVFRSNLVWKTTTGCRLTVTG